MNKGFTLIELLAVIVLLSVLSGVVLFSFGTSLNNSKSKLTDNQIATIEKAAQSYYIKEGINDEIYEVENNNSCVNLDYLIENGYINDDKIIDFVDNEELNGSVKINYKANQYSYKYQKTSCSNKDMGIICEAVTEDTKTTGNVPTENYLVGDEYICEVNDGIQYHFFILSSDSEKVNLILDRNLYYDSSTNTSNLVDEDNKGTVEWQKSGANTDGPVTVMDYLYNATKNWTNIPNIKINYTDEANVLNYGYGNIITTKTITKITKSDGTEQSVYENLKARLPYSSEIFDFDETNLWMYNYLSNNTNVYGEGLQNQSNIEGYWTFSSRSANSTDALFVYSGGIKGTNQVNTEGNIGIRPVISILKKQIK